MKDIKCKCSHLKSEHDKCITKYSDCKNCPCSKYVSKDYPEKKDKIGLWYCIGYAVFVVIGVLYVVFDFETIPDDILLQMITVETYKVTLYGLFAVMITIAIGLVFVDGIITFQKNKRRRDWN